MSKKLFAHKKIRTSQRRAVNTLLGVLGATLVLHGFLVVSAAVYAADHDRITTEIAAKQSVVGDLEAQYIGLSKDIDQNVATAHGFTRVEDPVFVGQTSLVSRTQFIQNNEI